ncbi:MAG TPA: ABC transporter ATP-binding protein, partial [Myxococcaceae bacterium]|nr:ABC transporter ATP-binding protein [Myxococcaceae bacterium]
SGCGKSTLLRLIAGLEPPQRGRILLGGEPMSAPGVQVPPEARNVGLVFQDFALFPHLSVLDNVAFGVRAPAGERRARALELLELMGMSEYAEAFPHTLSGGQQQRIAVARALAPGPRLMLLDEPFSGLDARMRERVRDDTFHVIKRTHVATVMVTHDPEEAMFMGDRIALMNEGRIVQLGSPAELYAAPASAFAASFLGEVNRVDAVVTGGLARTPLGDFPARQHEEGARVQVLIRPESVMIHPGGGGLPARVLAAHMLGRSSLIHLSADVPGGSLHLHARVASGVLPEEGEVLHVSVDPRRSFVFPAESERPPL